MFAQPNKLYFLTTTFARKCLIFKVFFAEKEAMCYIRRILHKIVRNAALVRALGVAILFVAIVSPRVAVASSIDSVTDSTPSGERFHVQWHTPKFIKFIDKQHGRFDIEGKTNPGVKIKIESNAATIDPPDTVHDLTLKEMAPSPEQITVGKDGRFKILLTLPFKHVEIPFTATASQSPARHYIVAVLVKKFAFKQSSRWNFGVQTRSVSYSQTNTSNLNENMLAATVSYRLMLSKHWSVKADTFMDLAGTTPFSTNQNEMSARFWGLNSDLVYLIPMRSQKWSLGIAGGLYYSTMFPSGQNFGYYNLWGPELYPIIKENLNNNNSLDYYFKYAPAGAQLPASFNSHEFTAGATWTRFYSDKRSLSLSLDFVQDEFIQNNFTAKANAINFGVSYGAP